MIRRGFIAAFSHIQFRTLNDFSIEMEQSIEQAATKHMAYLEEEAKKYSDEDTLDTFWDYSSDRIRQLYNDYPNLLRSSLLISCITNVEKTFTDIYDDLNSKGYALVSLKNKHLTGSIIEKVLQSINNKVSLESVSTLPEWDKVLHYIQIRNRVVHDQGRVHPLEYETLFNKIKENESLETSILMLNEYHELIFLKGFTGTVIRDSQLVVDKLIQTVYE